MKKLFFFVMVLTLMTGCSKSKAVQFCEGVSPEGEGVNCGTRFEEGELTAVIRAEAPFGVKTISLHVFEVNQNKAEKTATLTVDVRPDRNTASATLSLYTEGKYRVKAMSGNNVIGDGEISIVER